MPPQTPVEKYQALEARAKKAEEEAAKAEKDFAVAEDRLKRAKEDAKREYGTDDPAALETMAKESAAEAEAAAVEADRLLSEAGY